MSKNIYTQRGPLQGKWYLGNCFALLRVKGGNSASFLKLWVLSFLFEICAMPVTSAMWDTVSATGVEHQFSSVITSVSTMGNRASY